MDEDPGGIREKIRHERDILQEQRQNLNSTTVGELSHSLSDYNSVFGKVTSTNEAVLDSTVFSSHAEIAALKAMQMRLDTREFDMRGLVDCVRGILGPHKDFNALAEHIAPWTSMAARPEFLHGPLAVEYKERRRAHNAREDDDLQNVTHARAQQADTNDTVTASNLETPRVVATIAKLLEVQVGKEGVPLLRLVVNPDSFSQTVENLFYVSFLVRESAAALYDAGDDVYVFSTSSIPPDHPATATPQSTQMVLSLDMETWQLAIEKYSITASLILTRNYD